VTDPQSVPEQLLQNLEIMNFMKFQKKDKLLEKRCEFMKMGRADSCPPANPHLYTEHDTHCRSEFDWSQQGPQCGTIDKGGRAGTCWSQALGGNEMVPSHLEGGSIALVKINLEKMCPCQRLC